MKDERAAEGLDHLQAAALEMIKAARSFLDIVEDVVADPDKVAEVVAAFETVAQTAGRAAKSHRPAGDRDGDDDDGVQHIRVS